jgi:hypothetical protein
MKGNRRMKRRLFFTAILLGLAGVLDAAQPAVWNGAIVKADASTKSFTVKAKEGEAVIKYNDQTKFDNIQPVDASVLTEGCWIRINGKISKDNKLITAASIERLPANQKSKGSMKSQENFCTGKFHRKNKNLTVIVGDKTVAIKTTEETRYANRLAGTAADLKEGRTAQVSFVSIATAGERLAKHVVITTTAAPAKPAVANNQQSSPATVPAPVTPSEKLPEGAISGTVTAVGIQDLTVKIAKGGDTNNVVAYNITLLTEIVVNGKPGKLQDIKKGMKSTIVTSDGKNIERITAEGSLPPVKPTTKKSTPKKPKK